MKINFTHIIYRAHAYQRMFERGINEADIRKVLLEGEVIMDYPDDRPYPSYLVLGWCDKRPIHVVAAINEPDNQAIIITIYEPEGILWEDDFRRKA